jgi:DNA mismatch endonuclease (patch repair protein)
MDVMTREQRSRCMANIKGKDTGPELRLRRALWREGFRYILHPRLPGRPDLVFVSSLVAVFVDGCFWHGCPKHMTRPKTNRTFWDNRLAGNVLRDRRVTSELTGMGYKVLRFWEHEVEVDLDKVVLSVQQILRRRSGLSVSPKKRPWDRKSRAKDL